MSRSMLLVFLFVILIITSQFEWKQQLVPEVDTAANSQKQQEIPKREEAVKEKEFKSVSVDMSVRTHELMKVQRVASYQSQILLRENHFPPAAILDGGYNIKGDYGVLGGAAAAHFFYPRRKGQFLMALSIRQILLSQERNIQRLNEVVRSLREQLQQCRGSSTTNGTTLPSGHILELERPHVLED